MGNRIATVAAVAVALVAVTACGGEQPVDPGGTGGPVDTTALEAVRAGLVPRHYYDTYDENRPSCDRGGRVGAPSHPSQPLTDSAATHDEAAEAIIEAPPWEPELTEDNTFTDVGDTGFVPALTDNQSTFGLDVDTGSYRVAHHFVERGYQPPRESVRTEEWINAFDYGYQPPTETDLGLTVRSGAVPYTPDGTRLVGIGVDSRRIADEDRPAATITFVVDGSGSMGIRERLGLVKSSLALLVMNLRPDDTIAIVEFGSDAETVLEPTPLTEAEAIIAALDGLSPCGGTNMDAGLQLGYEVARTAYDPDRLNVVVLAGDGVGNRGLTDPVEMIEAVTEQGRDGINLVTLGFGMGNFNDTMLEQLANRGDGFYSYVNSYEDAERLFLEELTPTLTMVAGDAKVQVTFDTEVVESYRLIGYENRALADEDFRDDAVDAGELGAGHTATALYEVRLHDPDAVSAVVGEVALRWESLATGEVVEISEPLTVTGRDAVNEPGLAMAATVAYTAELIRGNSAVTGRQLDFAALIEDARGLARAGQPGADELLALLQTAQDLPQADD